MKLTEVNTWWKRALKKQELRETNKPKSRAGSWIVPQNFSSLAPSEKNARRRRYS